MSALIAGLEDDSGVAELLGQIVQDASWCWRLLSGGVGTLDALREFQPDLVTTGDRHPKLPGLELLKEMKRDPLLRGIPILFVTALPREALSDRVRRAGFNPDTTISGFVAKPFLSTDVADEIRRILSSTGATVRWGPVNPSSRTRETC